MVCPLVLDGLSLTVEGGSKVGICGRTGCGKPTLFGALCGLVERDGGATGSAVACSAVACSAVPARFGKNDLVRLAQPSHATDAFWRQRHIAVNIIMKNMHRYPEW